MGIAELDHTTLLIRSHFIIYGNAASSSLAQQISDEIETMWNEPHGIVFIKDIQRSVTFSVTAAYNPLLTPEEVFVNTDPVNNYFRVEEYAMNNISFVDEIGCNTGYFKLENLYPGSTTAAHEYGHTLGLKHPRETDIRGKGIPGIMYPRGTIVDAAYQYNSTASPGDNTNGGTMHPKFRKVVQEDIDALKLHKLFFQQHKAMVGDFSSIWHPDHATINWQDNYLA
jgi:hypothetical protein